MNDDPRLSRLFTYTVFHLGMYIPLGTALLAIFGSNELSTALQIQDRPLLVCIILGGIFLAGVTGAIVATACITAETFDDVWKEPVGAYGVKFGAGRWWTKVEHAAFWIAVFSFGILMLC